MTVDFYIEEYYIVRKTKSTLVNDMINENDIKKIIDKHNTHKMFSANWQSVRLQLLKSRTSRIPGGESIKYEVPIIYDFKGTIDHRKERHPRKPMDGGSSMEGHPWRGIDGDE